MQPKIERQSERKIPVYSQLSHFSPGLERARFSVRDPGPNRTSV
jgi:hypothetical protein